MVVTTLSAQVTVTSGVPTRLPHSLVKRSGEYRIESSQQSSFTLSNSNTNYNVQVGQLKSTNIINHIENPEMIREKIPGLDFEGGLWNTIFRGGGYFTSTQHKVKGVSTTFSEFGMKKKKEIVGSITALVRYAFVGNVRNRNTRLSSSKITTDFLDTLAVISQIIIPGDERTWHLEFLLIRGAQDSVTASVIHGTDMYRFITCSECEVPSRSYTMQFKEETIAGVEVSMSSRLFLLESLNDTEKAAFSCVAAILKNSFDLADSSY